MFIYIVKRIQEIDKLIFSQTTGSPYVLAKKIKVSERTLFEYIKFMKSVGAPITYSRKKQTYSYTSPGSFTIGFGY